MPFEIFELIKERNDGDIETTIQNTVELLDNLRNDVDGFTLKLDNILEDFAYENGYCPMCGEKLQYKNSKEISEYQGFEVSENIYSKCCPNHGCID